MKSAIRLQKPPLVATLLALLGMAVLIGLGSWQIQRLEWKTTLLNRLATLQNEAPARIREMDDLPDLKDGFANVQASGILLTEAAELIGPRVWDGQYGYHLYIPLLLEDQNLLYINLGWQDHTDLPPSLSRPEARVTGLLRAPERGNLFQSTEPTSNGTRNRLNLPLMAHAQGLKDPLDFVLYAKTAAPDLYLKNTDALTWQPNNNHLKYAVFWFSMAVALLGIYALRFVISLQDKASA